MRRWAWMLAVLTVAGCGRQQPLAPPQFGEANPTPYSPVEGSTNAFDAYIRAAQMAAQMDSDGRFEGPKHYRDDFPPSVRRKISDALAPAVRLLLDGAKNPCGFRYMPPGFLKVRRETQGWRLLGKVLAWRMEDQARTRPAEATTLMARVVKIGLDLTRGDAADAAAGWAFIDEIRAPYMRALGSIPSDQLRRLSEEVRAMLSTAPTVAETLENERVAFGSALQGLWISSSNKDALMKVEAALGANGREALKPLREKLSEGEKAKRTWFEALKARSEYELSLVEARAKVPTFDREPYSLPDGQPKPANEPENPARTLVRSLFYTGRYYLEIHDAGLARLRMLALSAAIQAEVRKSQLAPPKIPGALAELNIDPYTGKEFRYLADADTFRIYSPGRDGRDDGGKTDESFTTPDLMLEAQAVR